MFWLSSPQISLKVFLGSRGYLGIVPMVLWREHCSWCLLSIMWHWPGELTSEVLSSQFYRCSSGIPEFCRHRKSLLCSCWWDNLDVTQYWGVREYCHNSYNGCFSKVEVHDFRRFLGYVLTDGYNLDVGIVSLGEIYCFPCIPNTRLHNQKVSGVL